MDKVKRVAEAIHESILHLDMIDFSLEHILPIIPLDLQSYKKVEKIMITYLDQLLFRYIKLQDLMGKKMFPSLLESLDEDISEFVMKDILNRLEFLKVLDAEQWLIFRAYRNGLTHEYPGEEQVVVDSINEIVNSIPVLLSIIENCCTVLDNYNIDLSKFSSELDISLPKVVNINKVTEVCFNYEK
jgi:hypothetical protein